ncbi:helix-turn-helix transcriptional regulator [Sulfitobacter pontiacus]|uniref:helix-turn-helix transcriptional regulator n=1 Tax=Sulfitobacter pontiacus TaxID=60137 RepID=UPI0030EC0B74
MTSQCNEIVDRLVDMKTVCKTLSRSRASIYRDIKNGQFPKPVKRGHSSRWRVSDLNRIISFDAVRDT